MGSTDPLPAPGGAWGRIADELRACRESQRRAWGDVESDDLGRYLAGEADEGEAARIEHALEAHPELRMLTEVVREVLGDAGPAGCAAAGPPLAAEPPVLLRFAPRPRKRAGIGPWLRRRSSLVAAACLLVVLGAALPSLSPLAGPSESLPLGEGYADRRAGDPSRSLLADSSDTRTKTSFAAPPPAPLAVLNRAPKAADYPGMPAEAFDATKRGFHSLQHDGDLARAEREFALALAACQKHLRPNARATSNVTRLHADVYQTALNTAPPAFTLSKLPASVQAVAHDPRSDANLRASALRLRKQLTSLPTQRVRASIVPVLSEALRVAPDLQERRQLLRALAQLGPAAEAALPVLTARLAKASDASEANAILAVLEQMGPAGQPALPVLARLGGVTTGRSKEPALGFQPRPEVRQRAAALHAQLTERVGLFDRAGCFTIQAAGEAARAFRTAARRGALKVFVETNSGAPLKDCDHQDRATGRSLVVRLYLTGPVVCIEAGDDLVNGQQLAERLQPRLRELCKKKQYDAVLRELVGALPKK